MKNHKMFPFRKNDQKSVAFLVIKYKIIQDEVSLEKLLSAWR